LSILSSWTLKRRLHFEEADDATGPKNRYEPIALTAEENNRLVEFTRRHKTSQALALRARIVLACQQDRANNQVERWFATLNQKQIRRGTHRSTIELEQAIRSYPSVYNRDPKPFVWTKTADQILESIKRFCLRISNSGH